MSHIARETFAKAITSSTLPLEYVEFCRDWARDEILHERLDTIQQDLNKMNIPTGWRCPQCQAILAPTIQQCPHCGRTDQQDKSVLDGIAVVEGTPGRFVAKEDGMERREA